jgi:uncharacterized lipoprotein YajG
MNYRALALIVMALGLTGCVTGRRTVDLPVAPTHDVVAAATRGSVYIASITDDRVFQNKPSDPASPSIDGDVTSLSPQQKAQMIGRQRNTYGGAMGDIALPAGDSVPQRVRLLVTEGLARSGYKVSADPGAKNQIAVSVKEFWAWSTPGFWAISFEAKITCEITTTNSGQPHTQVVQSHGLNHGQVAKNANWQEAYAPAFDDFVTQLAAAVPSLGLRGDGPTPAVTKN